MLIFHLKYLLAQPNHPGHNRPTVVPAPFIPPATNRPTPAPFVPPTSEFAQLYRPKTKPEVKEFYTPNYAGPNAKPSPVLENQEHYTLNQNTQESNVAPEDYSKSAFDNMGDFFDALPSVKPATYDTATVKK